jgi:hypothetical protein
MEFFIFRLKFQSIYRLEAQSKSSNKNLLFISLFKLKKMTTIHVKAKFENVCKRFSIESTMSYQDFMTKIHTLYSIQNACYIKYVDDENDQIVISNEEEYLEAIHVAKDTKVFKIFISVDYSKPLQDFVGYLEKGYVETEKVVNQVIDKLNDTKTHDQIKKSLSQFGIMVQDGAMSAYTTTQYALNNLQAKMSKKNILSDLDDVEVEVEDSIPLETPKEEEEMFPEVYQKVQPTQQQIVPEENWMVLSQSEVKETNSQPEGIPSKYENELTFLSQMGFVDCEKNVQLLDDNEGDITKVVQILLN